MEVHLIREALVRSCASPLHSFLVPCLSTAWRPKPPTAYSYHLNSQRSRYLSISANSRSDPSSPTRPVESKRSKDARSNLQEIFDRTRGEQTPPSKTPPSNSSQRSEMIRDRLNELFPSGNPPPSSSPAAKEVHEAYRNYAYSSRAGMKPGSIAGSMLMPRNDADHTGNQQLNTTSFLGNHSGQPRRRSKRTIRSRPTVGRTVEVEDKNGVDLGRALTKLSQLIYENNVRQDQFLQKYHERPGLKRKRLKHDRWKRYFKAGFAATVQRVVQMRRQGW